MVEMEGNSVTPATTAQPSEACSNANQLCLHAQGQESWVLVTVSDTWKATPDMIPSPPKQTENSVLLLTKTYVEGTGVPEWPLGKNYPSPLPGAEM